MASTPAASTTNLNQQEYLRQTSLIVSGGSLKGTDALGNPFNGFDLSNLRIKFSVKRTDTQTPNTADIRVYNVENQTALDIFLKLSPLRNGVILTNQGVVTLQAGYESNYGVIFQGNIKQIILGRESATDTYIDIIAGDGHLAYNFSVVNQTLAAGSTQSSQIFASVNEMAKLGVTQGNLGNLPTTKLPRGKVMYGDAKNYLRAVGQNTGQTWSIQNGKVTFIPKTSYRAGTAVVLTSKTGLIGTPQQTTTGVNVKCLLNPLIQVGGLIKIDEASVTDFKIDLSQVGSAANIPAALNADGVYYVLVAEYSGDTRGQDWYCTLTCVNQAVTRTPFDSVQVTYGP